jgi:ketosteroid isomerase-like protein
VTEDSPRAAVERIVSAFGEGRLDDYFACFRPDTSFVFYTSPERLDSVQAYRDLWQRWVDEDGFRVVSCSTNDTDVREHGDVAVVTHSVTTVISTHAGEDTLHERETIVVERQPDGTWLGVHEHLSPMPAADG